ncbi:hypothetical protein [Gordonia sp. (in: high G+C Gram-positive bacteria)]|uniref:hypothetical protein n=1 Tax=Gordonia sp. (in: high G+C Gram-positive bacteria) TaxID=84139 RepID=UPI003C78980C
MPSNKKKAAAPAVEAEAAATNEDAVERVDLMDSLAIGTPSLEPVPVTLKGVQFSILRYFSPETVWKWSDLQRVDPASLKPTEVAENNRALLEMIIPADDHDKIGALLAVLEDRSVPEARRIFAYINNLAGLTDRQGNVLAL